jgi:hypothetical protein
MSRDGSRLLDFATGTYLFRLGWGELEKIQEACDAGPYVVLDRLVSGRWRVADIRETIRWGLIGGGMSPTEATKLVRDFVESRPPVENLVTAQLVLGASVVGAPEEEIEKKSEAPNLAGETNPSPTESSGSEPSTETAQG